MKILTKRLSLLLIICLLGLLVANNVGLAEDKVLYMTLSSKASGILRILPEYQEISGVKIRVDVLPYGGLQEKTYLELTSKTGFYDIFYLDVPWMPDILPLVQSLNDMDIDFAELNIEGFIKNDFLQTVVFDPKDPGRTPSLDRALDYKALEEDGFKIYGVPTQPNVLTMTYRKDLFENPQHKEEYKKMYGKELTVPETWQELLRVAQFFTRDQNGDGKTDLYGTTLMAKKHESIFCDFKTLLYSYRGILFDANWNAVFNSPEGVAALQFYVDLINKYKVTPPGVTSYSWYEADMAFSSGKTAIGFNFKPMKLSENVKGEVGYAPVPGKLEDDGKITRAPHAGTWLLGINKYSKNKEEAYKLIKWLTSKESQMKYAEVVEQITRESIFNDPAAIETFPEYYPVHYQSLMVGRGRPRITVYSQMSELIQVQLSSAVNLEKTPQQALDDAVDAVNKLMSQTGYRK
ncbi:MAG: extracellular solute-binding protein [Halanaerobiales bacterium]|nr:extracellular solute-binding protein [Halanaerobiales bacterium]